MEPKLSALVVDDEDSARKLLFKLLEETLFFIDIRLAPSVSSALNELGQFEPDLIFLDIKMPGKDGFSFIQDLQKIKNRAGIVFVTAYDHFAIKAIKNGAFDYLLKPVDRKELEECVLKYSERKTEGHIISRNDKSGEHHEKLQRIKVNTRTGTFFINPSSILFCKAEGNYTSVCTGEKTYLCSMNIGKAEKLLSIAGFIRIGRSLIINFEYITMLDRKQSTVTLVRDKESVCLKIPKHHLRDIDIC
jgi:two-component system LytT family response regulator